MTAEDDYINSCPTITGGCGERFTSTSSFDAHRIGSYDEEEGPNRRRCMTEIEMLKSGFHKNDNGRWSVGGPDPRFQNGGTIKPVNVDDPGVIAALEKARKAKKKAKISRGEVVKQFNLPPLVAGALLKQLFTEGKLERHGQKRGTFYTLKG